MYLDIKIKIQHSAKVNCTENEIKLLIKMI